MEFVTIVKLHAGTFNDRGVYSVNDYNIQSLLEMLGIDSIDVEDAGRILRRESINADVPEEQLNVLKEFRKTKMTTADGEYKYIVFIDETGINLNANRDRYKKAYLEYLINVEAVENKNLYYRISYRGLMDKVTDGIMNLIPFGFIPLIADLGTVSEDIRSLHTDVKSAIGSALLENKIPFIEDRDINRKSKKMTDIYIHRFDYDEDLISRILMEVAL